MPWEKFRKYITNDDIKRFQLKNRTANACKDTTDYQLRLENAMEKNASNIVLITKLVGHMAYLRELNVPIQQAAKETIDLFLH